MVVRASAGCKNALTVICDTQGDLTVTFVI